MKSLLCLGAITFIGTGGFILTQAIATPDRTDALLNDTAQNQPTVEPAIDLQSRSAGIWCARNLHSCPN